ncbi:quinon protein alcohol dehydrogenase-like superfamily [Suillus paluster]|uniref:quinon protein alcohol dehydrogenase-like superfamily n=1 Tax=Suillus paluster TaxID=48578 RepID=UPI001B87021B|nr:quinon protein alcohol dehydrogenase-like superfamily [Suillus paluster]KAG1753875.1 quinon protein alcohol dehydrogenase-like superfamily [Suillus paluster]
MRAQHTTHPLPAFPVYSCAFVASDQIVVGGGGGAAKTGIKNKLRLFNVSQDRQLEMLCEHELEKGEDAPMSIAAHPESRSFACGINSSEERLEKGENENCRVFSISNSGNALTKGATRGTLPSGALEDYQRVTVLSPDGNLLAVTGERDLSLLAYPSLSPVAQPVQVPKGEIYDVTFSSTHLVLATSLNLLVYALPKPPLEDSEKSPKKRKGKQKGKGKEKEAPSRTPSQTPELRLVDTIDIPSVPGAPAQSVVTFRAARFHPSDYNTLYTAVNTVAPRAKKSKTAKKQAYILKWKVSLSEENDSSWSISVEGARKAGEGGLTCFDISPNGKFLAFGSSDYSLGMLDSITLSHTKFPITTVRFSPTSTMLVSGGVDNSIRIVTVPEKFAGQPWTLIIMIILALLLHK